MGELFVSEKCFASVSRLFLFFERVTVVSGTRKYYNLTLFFVLTVSLNFSFSCIGDTLHDARREAGIHGTGSPGTSSDEWGRSGVFRVAAKVSS